MHPPLALLRSLTMPVPEQTGATMTDPTADAAFARRYFDLARSEDREAYFAQFTDDAVVEDDGRTHRGIDEIRAWRTAVPDVTYDVTEVAPEGDGFVATAEISGAFPGSPVTLRFHFAEVVDGSIAALRIAP
jgi:SnoaL-like protein